MAEHEGYLSINDLTNSKFIKIGLMTFINNCIIIMVVEFQIFGSYEWGKKSAFWSAFPLFMGPYQDFTIKFYFEIGVPICFTLAVNIVMPQIYALMTPVMQLFSRWMDRGICGCNKDLKKYPDNREDVNT